MENMVINKDFWKGKRVLITGHTGFKGSWLTLWLMSLGAEVWGISLVNKNQKSLLESIQINNASKVILPGSLSHTNASICDLTSLKKIVNCAKPEIVIHLAAQSLVREGYKNPIDTWSTNVFGSINLMESIRSMQSKCALVMITTDKVYENQNWDFGYRESDRLGGKDPYSASKAAMEIAIESWRNSFCGNQNHQTPLLNIASARAGNVIGGGDWANDRIIPDAIRALEIGKPIQIRSPQSTRPWQHVLEPLSGYLMLAEKLYKNPEKYSEPFNFGPSITSNRPVQELLEEIFKTWNGTWIDDSDSSNPTEAIRLHLQSDKSYHQLGWKPVWSFEETVEYTIKWYKSNSEGMHPLICCLADLNKYNEDMDYV